MLLPVFCKDSTRASRVAASISFVLSSSQLRCLQATIIWITYDGGLLLAITLFPAASIITLDRTPKPTYRILR